MGTLALDDCNAVRCWDLTRDRLRDDTQLRDAGITLEFFGDTSQGVADLANARTPAVRSTRRSGRSPGPTKPR